MNKTIAGAAFFIGGTILMNNSTMVETIRGVGIIIALLGATLLIRETMVLKENK